MKIVKVFPPAPPTTASESPPKISPALTVDKETNPLPITQNGEIRNSDATNSEIASDIGTKSSKALTPNPDEPVKPVFKTPKTPRTPRTPLTPLSPEAALDPEQYCYIVKDNTDSSDVLRTVPASELTRPKGLFTTAKLKLLLRSVLYRKSDRHPFAVKVNSLSR